MATRKIIASLQLPNGKTTSFKLSLNKKWHENLQEEILTLYPASDNIRFVDALPERALSAGKSFQTNIMFEIRRNYFVLGRLSLKAA